MLATHKVAEVGHCPNLGSWSGFIYWSCIQLINFILPWTSAYIPFAVNRSHLAHSGRGYSSFVWKQKAIYHWVLNLEYIKSYTVSICKYESIKSNVLDKFLTSTVNIKWGPLISTGILITFQYFNIYVYLITITILLHTTYIMAIT